MLSFRMKELRLKTIQWIAGWLDRRGSSVTIYNNNEPYLTRYYIIRTRRFSIYLHNFHADDPAGVHCHPWHNASFILHGGYEETHADGSKVKCSRGHFRFRQAEVFHRIVSIERDTWSLFFTGRRHRIWGFFVGSWSEVKVQMDKDFRGWLFPVCDTREDNTTRG